MGVKGDIKKEIQESQFRYELTEINYDSEEVRDGCIYSIIKFLHINYKQTIRHIRDYLRTYK